MAGAEAPQFQAVLSRPEHLFDGELVIFAGAFCIAGSVWFGLELPKVNAAMEPVYQKTGLLPMPDIELIGDEQEPAT